MPSLVDEVTLIAAQAHLRLLESTEIVRWANEQLERGSDLPSAVVTLATMSDPRHEETDDVLNQLLLALDIEPMDERRAGAIQAVKIANEILRSDVSPIDGARQLWILAGRVPQIRDELRPFIGLASEWEDVPGRRSEYDDDIRVAARVLVRHAESD